MYFDSLRSDRSFGRGDILVFPASRSPSVMSSPFIPWLHRFSKFVAAWTFFVVLAGGMVTSTDSGLAVPDWPTSYGYFMFSFPLSKMVGGIFYEHGHRLIASVVGFLTIVLAVWLRWKDARPWVHRLGFLALLMVILQGILGGITVIYFLPTLVSVAHAGLAQLFFCLVVSLALFTSAGWLRGYAPDGLIHKGVDDCLLRRLAISTTVTIYLQILVGAAMRHTGAGLAIPDFPLIFGGFLPPMWDLGIVIHFAHRVGAVIVIVMIFALTGHVWYHHRKCQELIRPAVLLGVLVILQAILGGFIIWTQRAVPINSAHVAVGALVFATALVLMLRVHRGLFSDRSFVTDSRGLDTKTAIKVSV